MDFSTPVMRQYGEIKRRHPGRILFFQMGDFYEMFAEDAVVASKILDIQLTSRDKNQANAVPMCGVPVRSYEQYVLKLTEAGHQVAICEQIGDPKAGKGIVEREVSRVISPGTVLSQEMLDATKLSLMGALFWEKKTRRIGIAFCEFTTGEVFFSCCDQNEAGEKIPEILAHGEPVELFVEDAIFSEKFAHPEFAESIRQFSRERQIRMEETPDAELTPERANETLKKFYGSAFFATGISEDRPAALCACGFLLRRLQSFHQTNLPHLRLPKELTKSDRMILDSTTTKNLEIFKGLFHTEKSHTLFGFMNRTETPPGARLLREILSTPFRDPKILEAKLDALAEAKEKIQFSDPLREKFRRVGDPERTCSRIVLPGSSVSDLVRLRDGIAEFSEIQDLMQKFESEYCKQITQKFDPLEDLSEFLNRSLMPEPSLKIKEGGFIAEGYHPELDELRAIQTDAKKIILGLESEQKEKTGISGLKIKYNRVFGYFLEISRNSNHKIPENYIQKQTLANVNRYITQELKELEEKILNAEEKIIELEIGLLGEIYETVKSAISRIFSSCNAIAEFDVICGLAKLAAENDYCRPEFFSENSKKIEIRNARHPVIENLDFDEPFIPNDLFLDKNNHFMMLITGPNMGGKSTFMRQIALIACMAQSASFVPAEFARLPIFDRIFTRVGASDHLARGQSTFMVEMNEAGVILNNATENSLVILDEIGRGTGTYDGISIAWSIADYLHRTSCFTLFATHYHELTELEDFCGGICNASVSVKEEGDQIIFLRKIIPGKTDRSYGIQVAKLAGLPHEVIENAEKILSRFNPEPGNAPDSSMLREPRAKFGKKRSGSQKIPDSENAQMMIFSENSSG